MCPTLKWPRFIFVFSPLLPLRALPRAHFFPAVLFCSYLSLSHCRFLKLAKLRSFSMHTFFCSSFTCGLYSTGWLIDWNISINGIEKFLITEIGTRRDTLFELWKICIRFWSYENMALFRSNPSTKCANRKKKMSMFCEFLRIPSYRIQGICV